MVHAGLLTPLACSSPLGTVLLSFVMRIWAGLSWWMVQACHFCLQTHLQSLTLETSPQLVLIIADYQYKSAFAVDQEINMVACLTTIMVECEFK